MANNDEFPKRKVEFENLEEQSSGYYHTRKPSRIVSLTIKYSGGYIKDETQANYALLVFAIVTIIISFILFFDLNTTPRKAIQSREDIPPEIMRSFPPGVWETIPQKGK